MSEGVVEFSYTVTRETFGTIGTHFYKPPERVVGAENAHTTRGSFHFGNNHSNSSQKGNSSAKGGISASETAETA